MLFIRNVFIENCNAKFLIPNHSEFALSVAWEMNLRLSLKENLLEQD